MKTIRLTEHEQEHDSGEGYASNKSQDHSNNNSNDNIHDQQITNVLPVSNSSNNLNRIGANAPDVTLDGVPINVTVNQGDTYQQPTHHEIGIKYSFNVKFWFFKWDFLTAFKFAQLYCKELNVGSAMGDAIAPIIGFSYLRFVLFL